MKASQFKIGKTYTERGMFRWTWLVTDRWTTTSVTGTTANYVKFEKRFRRKTSSGNVMETERMTRRVVVADGAERCMGWCGSVTSGGAA